jgi:chromosome segregation ATPase
LGEDECNAAKTFFIRSRASLTINGTHWEGGDADEQLAERLGFALSKKGVSRAETHGIPGLLWIEQGASADLAESVEHASSSLEERLKSILGEIASTSGSRLTAALQVELAKIRTATGRATGVLADVEKSLAETREERDQLQAKVDQYRSLSDSLARNIAERDRLDRERPWETYERQKRESEAQKAALEPQQRALEAERQRLREINASIDSQHEQMESRDKELRTLATQRIVLAESTQTHQQSIESLRLAEQRRINARETLRIARTQHQAAEQRQQHESLQAELERARAEIKRIEGILTKASQFAVSIGTLREQAAATKLSQVDLRKLSTLHQALHENRIQREAIATRIAFRLEASQRIDADRFGILEGSGSRHITAPVTLRIAGIGEIDIAPGGEDITRLSDEADRLQDEFNQLSAKLGVADLAAAEARHASHQALEQQIALREMERDTLLGEYGETEWRDQLADAQGQVSDRELRLTGLPAVEEGASVEEARRIFEDAEANASTVDEQYEAQRRAVGESELALATLNAQVDSASQRLRIAMKHAD